MFRRAKIAAALIAALSLSACANKPEDMAALGEGKQEFESISQGGLYRFQYVAEGSDGYRTVLWRQGDSLSDDGKDSALVSGVVKSVFKDRFCKELKLPVSLDEGSPRPVGEAGKWVASLRCAEAPAKPKPEREKKKEKAKPKPVETAAEPERSDPAEKPERAARVEEREERAPPPSDEPKPPKREAEAKSPQMIDGPMECVARKSGDGFDCRPLRR